MKSNLSKKLRRKNRNRRLGHQRLGMRMEQLEERRLLTGWTDFGTDLPAAEGESDGGYRDGEVLVRFAAGTTEAEKQALLNSYGMVEAKEFPITNASLLTLPESLSVPMAIDTLGRDPRVSLASPNNTYVSLKLIPNDPLFGAQWDKDNTGANGLVSDADIDAPEAWETFGTGTREVVVAVIDTGVDYRHEDLFANMWQNPGEIPNNGIDDDGNGYVDDVFGIDPADRDTDPMDEDDHGTHVTGILGAVGNNGIGIAGVNWNVKIMALRNLGTNGGTTAAAIESIDYATRMRLQYGVNVVVSNNSWGGGPYNPFLEDAFRAGINAGIVPVMAAGNGGADGLGDNNDASPFYPASYDLPGMLTVAATYDNDALAEYSNYGVSSVDLAAPGGDMGNGQGILSTVRDNGYDVFQGTSMAAPQVAGAVAYLRGIAPELTPLEVTDLILRGVDQKPSLAGRVATGGRLNLNNSAKLLKFTDVSGRVWADVDGDGVQDPMESGLTGWTVYLDANNNGQLDGGEESTPTGDNGVWSMSVFLDPGSYRLRVEPRAEYDQTFPGGDGSQSIDVNVRGEEFTDIDFGFRGRPGEISGVKFNDLNGNGSQDVGEPGIAGIYIYADLDQSGTIALGEPAAITDSQGRYKLIDVPAATVQVREILPPGWVQTSPGSPDYYSVDIDPGDIITGIDFGNQRAVDFGDAPAPYPTLDADGGAWAGLLRGFGLGTLIDVEPDGLPQDEALGDDRNNIDDEDGVTFPQPLFAGLTGEVEVTVMLGNNSAGVLQGWVDFNADGDWDDAGEQVIADMALGAGTHSITFPVPADAVVGPTFARFRYGYERGIGPAGAARAGEVEDYQVLILADEPQANDDAFQVNQDSTNNELLVLANDFPSSAGNLRVVSVTTPDQNGFVTITPDGQKLIYSPAPNFASPPFETFEYTVTDNSGGTDTATVSINVAPTFIDPVAVDDVKYVAAGSLNNIVDVLLNDVPGVNGPLTLVSVGSPSSGTAVISGDTIRYTPDTTFSSIDQFEYTVSNTTGDLSTATVTIFETPEPGKDVIVYVEPVDDAGNVLTEISVGEFFDLRVSVRDNRSVPSSTAGVAALYLDLLYDRRLVSVVSDGNNPLGFAVQFDPNYNQIVSGVATVPGILDEIGAFQSGFESKGPGKLQVFEVRMRANVPGTAEFFGDPADISPNHDILLFQPPEPALPADVSFGLASLSIVTNGALGTNGNGGTNAGDDPYDVNGDGSLSPLDVLLVINYLNNDGGSGEGEPPPDRMDINDDGMVSPLDALILISELNNRGQASGEGEALVGGSTSTVSPILDSTVSTDPSLQYASSSDGIDARDYLLQVGLPQSSRSQRDDLASHQEEELEDLLDIVAGDVDRAWS